MPDSGMSVDVTVSIANGRAGVPRPGRDQVGAARADELEALLRLSVGDLRSPAELAKGMPAARRSMPPARVALASNDHRAAREHLQSPSLGHSTPRRALVRQLLLAAAIPWTTPTCWRRLGGR